MMRQVVNVALYAVIGTASVAVVKMVVRLTFSQHPYMHTITHDHERVHIKMIAELHAAMQTACQWCAVLMRVHTSQLSIIGAAVNALVCLVVGCSFLFYGNRMLQNLSLDGVKSK